MDRNINTNSDEQNNIGVIPPLGFGHGHGGYGHYNHHYRNPYGSIVPFAGGLIGGLAVGALLGDNNNYGYGYGGYPNPYPYYGGYPYPPFYYGGYGYPYWRYS